MKMLLQNLPSKLSSIGILLQKLLWRLWAEIEAHKWRDLELNLSKTLSLFKPTARKS